MADISRGRAGSNPMLVSRFWLEVDGIPIILFKEFSGFKRNWSEVLYRNGNDLPRHMKMRGIEKIENVTIAEFVTPDQHYLEEWYRQGDKRALSFVEVNGDREEVDRHDGYMGCPMNLDLGGGDAMNESDVRTRSVEISIEDFGPPQTTSQ